LEEIFRGDDFKVAIAENGHAALNILRSLEVLPSIIFLDLMMPVMDGHRFLYEIQQNPENARFKNIPVVVVTAAQTQVDGHVVAILRKPPDLERLLELAEKYAL